jgi:hypothetical protein
LVTLRARASHASLQGKLVEAALVQVRVARAKLEADAAALVHLDPPLHVDDGA